ADELQDIGHADRVAHIGLRVVHDGRLGVGQGRAVLVGQVDAVAADGLFAQDAVAGQAVHNGLVIGRAAVVAVVRALADVDVEPGGRVRAGKRHDLFRDGE